MKAFYRLKAIVPLAAAAALILPAGGSGDAPLLEIKAHEGTAFAVKFSPDGKSLLTGGRERTVKVWDASSGALQAALEKAPSDVFCVAWAPDGRHAAAGSRFTAEDGAKNLALLWHVPTKKHLRSFAGPSAMVRSLVFTPDGKHLLSASDGLVRLWVTATGDEVRVFKGHRGILNSVALTPDAKFALSGGVDGKVMLWNVAKAVVEFTIAGQKERQYRNIASPAAPARVFEGHKESVTAVAVTPDQKLVLSASKDKTMVLRDITDGKTVRVFTGHTDALFAAAVSPDGRFALSGSQDRTARLWDLSTGKCLRVFQGHRGHVYAVDFSPDGGRVATASMDGCVRVWKL